MDTEAHLKQLDRKVADLFFGLKIIALLFLLVASAGNIWVTFLIDYYRRLYADALPGRPLPNLTLIVLGWSSLLCWLAFLWPLLGLATVFIRARIRLVSVMLAVLLVIILIQSSIVALALRMPMTSIIDDMSDSHP